MYETIEEHTVLVCQIYFKNYLGRWNCIGSLGPQAKMTYDDFNKNSPLTPNFVKYVTTLHDIIFGQGFQWDH